MSVLAEEDVFGPDVARVELTAENERLLDDELDINVAPEDRFLEENHSDNHQSDAVLTTPNSNVNASVNDYATDVRRSACISSNFGGRISLRAHRGRLQRARPYSRQQQQVVANQERGQGQAGEQARRPASQPQFESGQIQNGSNGLLDVNHAARATGSKEVIDVDDEDEVQVVQEITRVSPQNLMKSESNVVDASSMMDQEQSLKSEEAAENYAYNVVTEDEVEYIGEKNFGDSDAVLAIVPNNKEENDVNDVETIDVDEEPATTSSSDCDDEVVVIGGTFDRVDNLLVPKLENMEIQEDRLSDGTRVTVLVEATSMSLTDRILHNVSQNLLEIKSRPSKDNPKLFRGPMEVFKRKLKRLARKGRLLRLASGAPLLDLRDRVEEMRKERDSNLKAVGFTNPAKWGEQILIDKCRAYGKLQSLVFDSETFEAIAYFEESEAAQRCFKAFTNRDVGVSEAMKSRIFCGTPPA